MAASPLRSDYRPPTDPAALDRWLRNREDELAEVLARDITRIVQRSVRAFEATLPALTASGDMSVFDDIPVQWTGIVDERLLPEIEQVYLSGGINVWAAVPLAIPEEAALGWASIVNEFARDYVSQRRNLMVGVGDNLFQGVMQQVERAITTGASTEEIKQSLEVLGNFSEFRADTIARTEIGTAYSTGNWQASQALGEYGPVEKMWLATLDRRTRQDHADLNGTVLPVGQAFTVGGVEMMHPKMPGGPASQVVNCRCILLEFWPGDRRPDGSIVGETEVQFVGREFLIPL